MTRKLGSTQAEILKSLKQSGCWPSNWIWGSHAKTEKIMKRLMELGYVTKSTNVAGREVYVPVKPL